MNDKTKAEAVKWIMTAFMWGLGITMLMPLIWMISTSFKFESDVFTFPIQWIPERINGFENYKEVWGERYQFGLKYWNSIKVTVLATVFQVLVSALGAYGFTKVKWKYREQLFLVYLATMMIPPQVTIVSQFIIMRQINLYNTHLGLILLNTFSVYGVFLLKQAMMSIPESLSESAKIDGANHFRVFWQIIFPLVRPSVATLAILKFTWTWNDYQGPLVFLNSESLYTIQLGMKQFATEAGTYYSLIMAAAVSAILPLVIVFIIGQKSVIGGIASGGVKG
ncbi:MAG: carbohydrate ABC transporter permease [Bacillota bacterium]